MVFSEHVSILFMSANFLEKKYFDKWTCMFFTPIKIAQMTNLKRTNVIKIYKIYCYVSKYSAYQNQPSKK